MTYKAVIFDLFGTLAQNVTPAERDEAARRIAAALPVPQDDFLRLWQETSSMRDRGHFDSFEANLQYIFAALCVNVDDIHVEAASRIRHGLMRKMLLPVQGAVETLSRVTAGGFIVGVVSNCSAPIPDLWRETPFAAFVNQAVFSSAERVVKPDPRIYRVALTRLGVKANESLYIGDGDNDELVGAAQVGMHPVLVLAPHGGPATPYSLKRDQWLGPSILGVESVLTLL